MLAHCKNTQLLGEGLKTQTGLPPVLQTTDKETNYVFTFLAVNKLEIKSLCIITKH